MKTKLLTGLALFALIAFINSCKKDFSTTSNTLQAASAGNSSNMSSASTCSGFNYGDTIFYPEELPNDYVIHTAIPLTGSFGAYPDGLKIDALNGDIDITESETGLKYLVWYKAAGSIDTCKISIIVSGINFTDSIYTLKGANPVAAPVYNATLGAPVACTTGC